MRMPRQSKAGGRTRRWRTARRRTPPRRGRSRSRARPRSPRRTARSRPAGRSPVRVPARGPTRPRVLAEIAVDDRVAGAGSGQSGVEHPHGVVVREPGAQLPASRGPVEERADAGADGVDPVPVDVQPEQRLGSDLADAVEGVRAAVDVGAERLRARRPPDGVVARGVDDAGYVVTQSSPRAVLPSRPRGTAARREGRTRSGCRPGGSPRPVGRLAISSSTSTGSGAVDSRCRHHDPGGRPRPLHGRVR